jgi:hypothetical protein
MAGVEPLTKQSRAASRNTTNSRRRQPEQRMNVCIAVWFPPMFHVEGLRTESLVSLTAWNPELAPHGLKNKKQI